MLIFITGHSDCRTTQVSGQQTTTSEDRSSSSTMPSLCAAPSCEEIPEHERSSLLERTLKDSKDVRQIARLAGGETLTATFYAPETQGAPSLKDPVHEELRKLKCSYKSRKKQMTDLKGNRSLTKIDVLMKALDETINAVGYGHTALQRLHGFSQKAELNTRCRSLYRNEERESKVVVNYIGLAYKHFQAAKSLAEGGLDAT